MPKKLIVVFTLLAVLFILPLYAIKISLIQGYTDFDVYYRTAVRVKAELWDQIYTLQDGASPFRYAPLFIPLFRPFAAFTLLQARQVWFFLQYCWFGLGFYFIYLTLQITGQVIGQKTPQVTLSKTLKHSQLEAATYTSLGLLFILRFCLDTFTIGQVSSLMFLGFSIGLYGWVLGRPVLTALGLLPPTLLKIGPGFLFGIFSPHETGKE